MLAKIEFGEEKVDFYDPNQVNLLDEVTCKETKMYNPGGSPTIVAYHCGMKNNIMREFIRRGVALFVVPYDYDIDSCEHKFDGVFISNGPGLIFFHHFFLLSFFFLCW
jgi:carbamoyl-phosphate synthase small subunit